MEVNETIKACKARALEADGTGKNCHVRDFYQKALSITDEI
jgi:hypothetical protein